MRSERDVRFERDVLPLLDCVYSAALCMTGDPRSAERLVETCMIRAFVSYTTLEGGKSVKVWLYRHLVEAYDHAYRKDPGESGRRTIDCEAAPSSIPQRWAEHIALISASDVAVRTALREVHETLRMVVYLSDAQGFTAPEIAEIMGVSVCTVAIRLSRGRRQLRKILLSHHRWNARRTQLHWHRGNSTYS